MTTISNVSLVTVYVQDQTAAKQWYIDKLGFVETTDVTMGDSGFRWVTVAHPDHLELEVTLMVPSPPLDEPMAEAIRRALANGTNGGWACAPPTVRKPSRSSPTRAWSSCSRRRSGPTAWRPCAGTTPATGWCWSSRGPSIRAS